MNISPDDPKLTAYALGELPENERKEIESELQKSPELRAALEEIRQTADLLKSEFSTEPALTFSAAEKDAMAAKVQPDNIVPLRSRNFWLTAGIGAMAASIVLFLAFHFSPSEKTVSLAKNEKEELTVLPLAGPKEATKSLPATDVEEKPKSSVRTASTPATAQPQPKATLSRTESLAQSAPPSSLPLGLQKQADLPALGTSVNGGALIAQTEVNAAPAEGYEFKIRTQSGAAAGQPTIQSGSDSTASVNFYSAAPVSTREPAVQSYGDKSKQFERLGGSTVENFNLPRVLIAQNGSAASSGVSEGHGLNFVTKENKTRTLNDNVRAYFENSGVDLQSESSVFVNDRSGKLLVRAPGREMKKIQSALEKAGVVARHEVEDSDRSYTLNYDIDQRFLSRFAPKETARYPKYVENSFESVLQNPLSTFSIDVDTASYANVRRFLNDGQMPPHDAVRVEELINYFSYDYPQPKGDEPFSANIEVTGCPWNTDHRLVRVGLKGREIAENKRPPSNFVFLIDVSGSMQPSERLPLIKQSLRILVKRMTENDRIAIVVYASNSGTVLESTSCANKEKILEALDRLEAGGSTNGGEGIQRAYGLAEENFIKGGVNRVILCTDGDFNVGITDQGDLIDLIQRKAKSGVFLSALGVGTDNYKDALLQKLADKGNGNYHYIDTLEEGHKVLVQQMNGTLVTIAKDVKIQIEFNPAQVASYRLIGYEKRILAAEDFNNDKKDAGEIGAGHTVTALYEIVPAGVEHEKPRVAVDDLKYQNKLASKPTKREVSNDSKELLTLKLRWKKPDGDKSKLSEFSVVDEGQKFSRASSDFKFAAAVASFGMILKDSEFKGEANFRSVLELAEESKGDDKEGYRAEFINLVKKAKEISKNDR